MKAVILGWKRDYLKKYLSDCEIISKKLVEYEYDVYTGGGGGFMKMGNKGAFTVNPHKSYGITTDSLNNKEGKNGNILEKNLSVVNNFTERKNALYDNANILIFFPGGMGTLDEFTDVLNLIKTDEYEPVHIILYGHKYWNSLLTWFEFNNIKFPFQYINGVVDTVEQFDMLLDEINHKKKAKNKPTINKLIVTVPDTQKNNNHVDAFIKKIFNNPDNNYTITKKDDNEVYFEIIIPNEDDSSPDPEVD